MFLEVSCTEMEAINYYLPLHILSNQFLDPVNELLIGHGNLYSQIYDY